MTSQRKRPRLGKFVFVGWKSGSRDLIGSLQLNDHRFPILAPATLKRALFIIGFITMDAREHHLHPTLCASWAQDRIRMFGRLLI